jgi:nucleotide-binding universal stress UspA family protein
VQPNATGAIMTIRTLLVPVEDAGHTANVIAMATALARATDGHIEGCPLERLYIEAIGAVEPLAGVVLTTRDNGPVATPEQLRATFESAMAAAGVPAAPGPGPALGYSWAGNRLVNDAQFAALSRAYDVAVAGRPNPDDSGPRLSTLEGVLFEGGRPVLVAPPEAPGRLGSSIVIAWNCSTESARSVSFAMGLIEKAERVCVLTVEGGTVAGPSGADLCRSLKAHGVEAQERTVSAGSMSVGQAILHHAGDFGADLIVKGAYTQSRLRQMVFGGPTSHLLYHSGLPVLFAC